ncbi:undecaprenyl-phosphate alpha-N-acetylglucosaminyl 1-phosphate transferase [Leptolinea sp. HRD-7]|jgi:UDP-GlcNAc:undecaprenyl-phosphate GlcNAc-1-phosphate transferase|nr:undecaprenyl-phosphate alpha-N-acetylglucosaminyl 1-phosphate transferase [Leptolinea sp. HRD-7]
MNASAVDFSGLFQAILVSLLLTLVTGYLGIQVARRIKLMDFPGAAAYKTHKVAMPYAGGMALTASLIILVLATGLWKDRNILTMLLAALVIFVFGIWDDYKRLPALPKFLGQLVATIGLVLSGLSIQILESHTFFIGGSGFIYVLLDRFLTVFWIVGVTNAFNLVDSMDGLAVGLSGWAFAFFMLATLQSGQESLAILSAILVGICLAIFYFNSNPARMFLGDSGAQTLGFILAVMAINYNPVGSFQSSSYLVPIFLVGVPIFDTTMVTISRVRRRLPFYKGNRDHTYHRLVALGLDPSRAVLTMHMAALVLDCLAFMAVILPPIWANTLLVVTILLGIVLIIFFEKSQK